eukprot:CAMPEP_0174932126 /NCGR_PEP_ID=MMETSP1355-20121228/35536_1 /TAXON_ID=464990 /ORGANISM="Hemiselmis tepida, Strain CCMP443" /LENGTH=101 /DNA_ID=CAMNT_0016178525 /DNA_START=300 /DNA_END=602 /DNA_ORIENTATION=-
MPLLAHYLGLPPALLVAQVADVVDVVPLLVEPLEHLLLGPVRIVLHPVRHFASTYAPSAPVRARTGGRRARHPARPAGRVPGGRVRALRARGAPTPPAAAR